MKRLGVGCSILYLRVAHLRKGSCAFIARVCLVNDCSSRDIVTTDLLLWSSSERQWRQSQVHGEVCV